MRPTILLVPMMLAACHAKVDVTDTADQNGSAHVVLARGAGGDQLSVNVPGFQGKVSLPSMNLGGQMDLDGIRLAPDTSVRGMDVVGHDQSGAKEGGRVVLTFANAQAPASLIDYYARAARDAGYDPVASSPSGVAASKGAERFALAVAPAGTGSKGTITLTGRE